MKKNQHKKIGRNLNGTFSVGFKHSPETINKMKGRKVWNKGMKGKYTFSEEVKKQRSIDLKKAHSKKQWGFKKGISPVNKGFKMPIVSLKMKGNKNSVGDKNGNWISDRKQLKKNNTPDRRLDYAMVEWRNQIYKRDMWKCKINNKNCSGHIEAHHILPWVDYPELRYDTNNGITLCHAHHPRKQKEVAQLSPYFYQLIGINK